MNNSSTQDMKTTLALLAFMVTAVATAGENTANLLYGLDFETHGTAPNIATTPGTTEISITGYVNYAPNQTTTSPLTMDGSGYYHVTNNGTFRIDGGETGITDSSGNALTVGDGFTISLNVMNLSSQGTGWRDVMDFKIDDATAQLQWGSASDSTTLNVYGIVGSITLNNLQRDTWYNVTLSFQEGAVTMAAYDKTGTLVSSATKEGLDSDSKLTYVQGGGALTGRGASHIMDNFAIYDSAISLETAQQLVMAEVASHGLPQSIPEPATATLPLLALIGLAGRRRRR